MFDIERNSADNSLMHKVTPSYSKAFRKSLRVRIAMGVAIPVLIIISLLSGTHYQREKQLLSHEAMEAAIQLSNVTQGSLQHAMLADNPEMVNEILVSVGNMANVQLIQLINLEGQVRRASKPEMIGSAISISAKGCRECHQYAAQNRPLTTYLAEEDGVLRVSTPIENAPACAECHTESGPYLGFLLLDVSTIHLEEHLIKDLAISFLISILSTILISLGVYFLIHRLVVRRIETFRTPLAKIADGDLSVRLPTSSNPSDEIDALAAGFNHMAHDLETLLHAQKERSQIRQRAIVDERERIARELHDGLAQLLGYVNTKAMAVRFLLTRNNIEKASKHLEQLEEAARELFTDTREAIFGLKISTSENFDLGEALTAYSEQFQRLSNIPIHINIDADIIEIPLEAEVELQLLRICQEALTNVRKHALATQTWLHLYVNGEKLEIIVEDNGVGFNSNIQRDGLTPRFGLGTMQERAEAIGAELEIASTPGNGTRVIIQLTINQRKEDASIGS